MIVKMKDVVALSTLKEKINSAKMPLKVTYKFAKLFSKIDAEVNFYSTKLNEIIQRNCEYDEQGQPVLLEDGSGVRLEKDKIEQANKELNELQNLDVELEVFKVSLDELENLELNIDECGILMNFIEE